MQINLFENTNESGRVIFFLCFLILGVFFVGVILLALALLIRIIANSNKNKTLDNEYYIYMNRGYILRFFYGFNVSIDILLQLVEIFSAGATAYFVLLEDLDKKIVVVFLILAYTASILRNSLQLKNTRKAYAKAFRILEFATDDYRSSSMSAEDKKKLHKANEEAQKTIAEYFE